MPIQFKEIKKYLSRVTKLSIAFRDGHYENYLMLSDIPNEKYDEMYVYGIGTANVEFPLDVYISADELSKKSWDENGCTIDCALEIVLQEEPRDIERVNKETLTFGDLRGYLQIGRNFLMVRKEDWSSEKYVYRNEIPDAYNEMYVYGIGVEKNLVIAVSERRRND